MQLVPEDEWDEAHDLTVDEWEELEPVSVEDAIRREFVFALSERSHKVVFVMHFIVWVPTETPEIQHKFIYGASKKMEFYKDGINRPSELILSTYVIEAIKESNIKFKKKAEGNTTLDRSGFLIPESYSPLLQSTLKNCVDNWDKEQAKK